ncbi:hypothetical protein E9232_002662 [Inquilinus ginsengisoli]|uniref:DUF2934 domain-containing protein n=1 Tax=Inquilinus ginsengisoli TaxID=363840 RepID=A0ABU1JNE9_9PROT|nr:DUF2934 domain-containing protein [Inquilinus ginsengisoli]MDR6290141.1 hypothetical protein [Inquilinus ginsengisoli]
MATRRSRGESPDTRTVDPNEPFEEMPVSPDGPGDTDRIRERAHEIWREEGCPKGHADEHWRRAEIELTDRPVRE